MYNVPRFTINTFCGSSQLIFTATEFILSFLYSLNVHIHAFHFANKEFKLREGRKHISLQFTGCLV